MQFRITYTKKQICITTDNDSKTYPRNDKGRTAAQRYADKLAAQGYTQMQPKPTLLEEIAIMIQSKEGE